MQPDAADYRWAVEILHKLVFAQPENQDARELQADAYEQMGYQSEGPQWRGIFLTAALELRSGVIPISSTNAGTDTMAAIPIDVLFDIVAIRLKGPEAAMADFRIDLEFTDDEETWTMWVKRGVLHARRGASDQAQLTVSGPKLALVRVLLQPASTAELLQSGHITLDGDDSVLDRLGAVLDTFDRDFNVVTP